MSLLKQTVTKVWLVLTGSGSVTFLSGTVCDLTHAVPSCTCLNEIYGNSMD